MLHQLPLFVSGWTPRSRHASHQAAVKVSRRRGPKTVAYLKLLATRGALTDHAAFAALKQQGIGVAFSSMQSIRSICMTAELVKDAGEYGTSPYGHKVTKWTLTAAGRAAVAAMKSEAA